MTTGGLGVAFFAPFHDARYFFPFRPILVSPIGVGRFFSQRGLAVIGSEMVWIWGPALVLAVVASIRRRRV
jgi:inner membrane protein